jgi:proteic killer suppression protein
MIRSVRGTATREFIERGKSRFSGMDERIARRRVAQLSAATSLESFGRLNSVGLHKLKGDLKGFWAITINGPWRLLFKFHDRDAHEVHIRDYHG